MIEKILEDVAPKRKVLILTHNNPDPDTIAAAQGMKMLLHTLLKKRCTIAYHGIIGRAENRELIKSCKIDMYQSTMLNFIKYDYMIVVDTQPTAGNVYIPKGFFPYAVIDHHNFRRTTKQARFYDVRPEYGSTSTIICEYFKEKGVQPDVNTATALYYGMKTDTVGSGRTNTNADMEMMAFVFPHISLKKLTKIEGPELPRYYFKNIKKAIECSEIYDDALICDLNDVRNADLIAETSDFLLRMRDVKWTFIYGRIDDVLYFSLRSKSSRKKVGSIAMSVTRGIGTGGGHMKSAGGQVPLGDKTYEEMSSIVKERVIKRIGLSGSELKRI